MSNDDVFSDEILLQSQRISKMKSGSCIVVERRESISCEKNILQVAPNCAALNTLLVCAFCFFERWWWLLKGLLRKAASRSG